MLKQQPVRGMRDIMPDEMAIRNALLQRLRATYSSFGFTEIETPCAESIENLTSNNGGENEKLVFKIMKRGDKLERALQNGAFDALADSGLRYDLTLPLSRYYACHSEELPNPFKALQIGFVWRADRPQAGRYRQFMQCDIDILGDASINAEIELVSATSSFLKSLEIGGLVVHINDRRILEALVRACDFISDGTSELSAYALSAQDVLITLDKYDKIGMDDVCAELAAQGATDASISEYKRIFSGFLEAPDALDFCEAELGEILPDGVLGDMRDILQGVQIATDGAISPVLDIKLVRGMGYYTGPVFEITSSEFEGSSIAGGGRYDKMVGKYTGADVPACGFSIGFERLVNIMMNREDSGALAGATKRAILYDKDATSEEVSRLQAEASKERAGGAVVLIEKKKRNLKHQRELLESQGYTDIQVL